MKTPDRWRPSHVIPSLSVFFPTRLTNTITYGVTSHDVTQRPLSWERVYCYKVEPHRSTFWNTKNDNMATLTFDLWPWPPNLAEILPSFIATPNFVTLGQTVRLWERSLTDTRAQKDRTNFIPSTADAEGENHVAVDMRQSGELQ